MVVILLFGVIGIFLPVARSQVVDSTQNPNQIAILHWYGANTITRFAVGIHPAQIAFDGTNVWVANYGSNTVTKLQANDGKVVGTFSVGANTPWRDF
jgi:DNA-binding beta-propeller fold protein YncE